MFLITTVIASITMLVIACSKSAETDFTTNTGGNTCDTTSVKYALDIVPILQGNCYSCHGSGSTGGSGGIDLSTYAKLKVYASNGYLVGNVTHAPGYVPMPYGQAQLPSCEVNKIVAWVHQGAQNN